MTPVDDLKRLQRRLRDDPASKVFLPLAEVHRRAGRAARAVAILKTGLQENPHYTAARVALGRLLLEQGRRDEARRELAEAVRQAPDNLLGVRLLAKADGVALPVSQDRVPPVKEPPIGRHATPKPAPSWTLPPRWSLPDPEPGETFHPHDGPDPAWSPKTRATKPQVRHERSMQGPSATGTTWDEGAGWPPEETTEQRKAEPPDSFQPQGSHTEAPRPEVADEPGSTWDGDLPSPAPAPDERPVVGGSNAAWSPEKASPDTEIEAAAAFPPDGLHADAPTLQAADGTASAWDENFSSPASVPDETPAVGGGSAAWSREETSTEMDPAAALSPDESQLGAPASAVEAESGSNREQTFANSTSVSEETDSLGRDAKVWSVEEGSADTEAEAAAAFQPAESDADELKFASAEEIEPSRASSLVVHDAPEAEAPSPEGPPAGPAETSCSAAPDDPRAIPDGSQTICLSRESLEAAVEQQDRDDPFDRQESISSSAAHSEAAPPLEDLGEDRAQRSPMSLERPPLLEVGEADLVPESEDVPHVRLATSGAPEVARKRQILFLKSWIAHLHQEN